MARRLKSVSWFIAGAVAIFALGAYGAGIAGGERGSFVMNFPAIGKAAGGPSARALTGSVTVPISSAGVIKRLIQPNVVQIASHSIRNVGATPRSIRFETVGFPDGTEWECRDLSWDPVTHTVARKIAPGQAVDLGFVVTFPRPLPDRTPLMAGRVLVRDAATGELLSELPVTVVQTGASVVASGSCCE